MRLPNIRIPLPRHHSLTKYLALRISAYRWLREHGGHYDAILVRHPLGDPLLPHFIKHLDNTFTIHHTNELGEINRTESLAKRIQYAIEKRAGKTVLASTRGIVGLTEEILRAELRRAGAPPPPGFVSPNGIELVQNGVIPDQRGGKIKLVSVCSKPYPWHGIDRIVSALKNSSNQDIEIHLIGDVTAYDFGRDARLNYHGIIPHHDLTTKLGQFDMGLGSFALDRNGMTEACTLKTREYLAAGLPVLAHHRDAGLPEDFPYFINEAFSIERAVELARAFRSTPKTTIREISAPYIDKRALLQKQAEWILSQCV